MKLTISIVIIGDSPMIIPCLETIEAQTSTDHEIYLVENLASPAFIDKIVQQFPKINLIHVDRQLSFAQNHNLVFQRSHSEFFLLLNDDVLIKDHALDKMVEFMENQPENVGVAGCTNLDPLENFTLSCHPFPNTQVIVWQHAQLRRWFPNRVYDRYRLQATGTEPFPVDWVKGSCLMIRRKVIEQIGYLDEDFFLFSEEVDYCYRTKQAGFSIYQVPNARIVHYESATTSRFVPIKLRGHYLSKLYFLAKHGFKNDLPKVQLWFIAELLFKSAVRGLGALIGRPPDAQVRLLAYLDLIRLCATYQGQTARELIKSD